MLKRNIKKSLNVILSLIVSMTVCSCSSSNKLEYPIKYEDGYDTNETIYVIGHTNPDADTVCSSIAYAYFLNAVGIKAEAAISGSINSETNYILNMYNVEVPNIVSDATNKQFVLVDHSSYNQSIYNMEDANVLAIIDHHAIEDIQTSSPILWLTMPVGSTATIIYYQFNQYDIKITKPMAGIILSAILSDTLGLKSPITTAYDIDAVNKLMKQVGVKDYEKYTSSMLEAGNNYDSMSIEEIIYSDFKNYKTENTSFVIALVQSAKSEQLIDIEKAINEYMEQNFSSIGVDMCFIMLVNYTDYSTKLLCYGKGALDAAKKAFNLETDEIILKDTVSRKLQIAPYLKGVL